MVPLSQQSDHQKKNNMNLLAIDYGTRRIGLAWMEEGLDLVLPFGVIESKDIQERKRQLIDVIQKRNIQKLVVGLPIGTDGNTETENAKRVKTFISLLHKEYQIPVVYVDERFSSQQADNTPGDATRDEKAAMIIMEQYLRMQEVT